MTLLEDRLAHTCNGQLYLARAGETNIKAYRDECRQVYGDLRGIKFYSVKAGTHLMAPAAINSGYPVPHSSQMEELK